MSYPKFTLPILLCLCAPMTLFAQGSWLHVTDPGNAISSYTTNFGYVGASMVDFNRDGALDIYAAPTKLYLNDGTGSFTNYPSLPFTPLQGVAGASWADLDNDGDLDAVVACAPSKVFLNNAGTFRDSTPQVPGLTGYPSWAVAIGDFNGDPLVDFVFAHANGFHSGQPRPCKFYTQTSPAFGADSTVGYPFTSNLAPYTVPFWSDYDLDGDMDLFIASGPATGTPDYDPCFKNLKKETGMDTLVAMTTEAFALQTQDGQCYNFIDHDNDRDLDLCLTNYFGAPTRFYRNDTGTYVPTSTSFTNTTPNLANCWGDYDNDGDLDAVVTNGNVPARYHRNNGNGTFTYLSTGFSTATAVAMVANGDVDNDGDLDLFANGIGNNGSGSSLGLYLNDGLATGQGFAMFSLTGTVSNRSAIGAIVHLKATIGGNPVWQMREVNAQNTFQGQNDLRVHFGLGDATSIDSVRIQWPSDSVEHYTGLSVNAFYSVVEGAGISTSVQNRSALEMELYPNPASDILMVRGQSLLEAPFTITDIQGRRILQGTVSGSPATIPVERLSPGYYILKVEPQGVPVVRNFQIIR